MAGLEDVAIFLPAMIPPCPNSLRGHRNNPVDNLLLSAGGDKHNYISNTNLGFPVRNYIKQVPGTEGTAHA